VPSEPRDLWLILPRGINDRIKTGGDMFETVIGAFYKSMDEASAIIALRAWVTRTFTPLISAAAQTCKDYELNWRADSFGGVKRTVAGYAGQTLKRPRLSHVSPVRPGLLPSVKQLPTVRIVTQTSGVEAELRTSIEESARPHPLRTIINYEDVQARPIRQLPLHAHRADSSAQAPASTASAAPHGAQDLREKLATNEPQQRFGDGSLQSHGFRFPTPARTDAPIKSAAPLQISDPKTDNLASPGQSSTRTSLVPARPHAIPPAGSTSSASQPAPPVHLRLPARPLSQAKVTSAALKVHSIDQEGSDKFTKPPSSLQNAIEGRPLEKASKPADIIDLTVDDDDDEEEIAASQSLPSGLSGSSIADPICIDTGAEPIDDPDEQAANDRMHDTSEDMEIGYGDDSVVLSLPAVDDIDDNMDDEDEVAEVEDLLGTANLLDWLHEIGPSVSKVSLFSPSDEAH
jgi:hypothetical protein